MDAHKDALVAGRGHESMFCVNGKIIALQINTGNTIMALTTRRALRRGPQISFSGPGSTD